MFRPLKNFLNYIQKNTSGSSLFGGLTESPEVPSGTKSGNTKENSVKVKETAKVATATTNKCKMSSKRTKSNRNTQEDPTESKVFRRNDFAEIDVNDVETQIKSNVMMRREPQNTKNSNEMKNVNGNHTNNNDELECFNLDTTGDSVVSEEPEIVISDDEGPSFTNLGSHEFNKFSSNELIVLNEPEVNNSICSDELSEDPLALDEFAIQSSSLEVDTLNLLGSQRERSNDDFWFGIDDIKECAPKSDLPKNTCNEDTTKVTSIAPIVTEKHEEDATDSIKSAIIDKPLEVKEMDENREELRSEGSDSGLGLETSTLQITITSREDNSHCSVFTATSSESAQSEIKREMVLPPASEVTSNANQTESIFSNPSNTNVSLPKLPKRSNLKRHIDESGEEATLRAITEGNDASMPIASLTNKKPKRSINFDRVQVFYFPRQQGFGCVPSAGGCTLGMGAEHVAFKTLTLAEHAAEIRRAHRQQLQEASSRAGIATSSEDSEESEEDFLSEGSGSDMDAESSGFLQPVSPKQRRVLLKAAGVRKIDASEKAECRDIRNSREVCGCTCRDFCDPETCACSQAGIKCQVDRAMFPCGCSRDACGNIVGRVEFNPSRVRTHFIHTIMRLEMESRQLQRPNHATKLDCEDTAAASSLVAAQASVSLNPVSNNFYSMQPPQSNFSSGYASPAYPPLDPTAPPVYYLENEQPNYVGAVIGENTSSQLPYQIDGCLGQNIFPQVSATDAPYGDLMTSTYTGSNASLIYNNVSNGIAPDTSIPSLPYSYNGIDSSQTYLPINDVTPNTNSFSSCSVPSAPPFGSATTTTASAQYHNGSSNISNCSLESITITSSSLANGSPNCNSALDDATSFISLNSPVPSSSRLSAINDLLQHNRNTKSALVAVSSTNSQASLSVCNTTNTNDLSIGDSSLISSASLSCGLTFGGVASPLISALVETNESVDINATSSSLTGAADTMSPIASN